MKQVKNEEADGVQLRNTTTASSQKPRNELEICVPGCSCSGETGGKGMRIATILLILVAVVVAFVYKKLS